MPVDKSPEAIRNRAKALVQSGADGTNKNAAASAAIRACKLIKEHHLLDQAATPVIPPINIGETIQKVRETMADPNVAATVSAGAELVDKLSAFLKARRGG